MKATEINLQGLLGGQNQYIIPVFQRYYTWGKENWSSLWEDIEELYSAEQPNSSHFMGTLVLLAEPITPGSNATFQVIDGQQRTITFVLLLCALRNIARELNLNELVAEINETTLVHRYKKNQEHYRVAPRQRDRDQFFAAVDGRLVSEGSIGAALNYFTTAIRRLPSGGGEEVLRDLFNLLKVRLDFVAITLKDENPYRIFRSLNSTGVDLSEADLIRNLVFMHVPANEQDDFDDKHWKELERRFFTAEGRLDGAQLSNFFRDFLMSAGKYVPLTSIFQEFEQRYSRDLQPTTLVETLKQHAVFYDMIRGVEPHNDPQVAAALRQLRQLESTTPYPLLLNLMRRLNDGVLQNSEFARAVELITGFILRRLVCGESSRQYARRFVSACNQLGSDIVEGLHSYLTVQGFPDDSKFAEYFASNDIYSSRYSGVILAAIERAQNHKELVANLDQATVEHIMPQQLTDEWRDMLGESADAVHSRWLHTIGNLTLTGYNSELSNHAFEKKRQAYEQSNIQLTREVAKYHRWADSEIIDRGRRLAVDACRIWLGPKTA